MNPKRIASSLAAAILAATVPLAGQSPLFVDGPAFGGSKVFSEGRSPLGNPARYDQSANGWYLSYLDGDQRAKDNKSLLQDSAAGVAQALVKLQDAPWAQRTRAYGVAGVKDTAHFAFTREQFNTLTAIPDLDPSHTGTGNLTLVQGRRVAVDRISIGGGGMQSNVGFGASLRIEQWHHGLQTAYLNPGLGQLAMTDLDSSLLSTSTAPDKSLTYSMDMGLVLELAQGLRFGLTADQLNTKRLWEVELKPQFRAGLQFDLGSAVKLAVEGDLNPAARMPFPEKQQTTSASLRIASSPAVAFVLGAERRKIGDASVTRGGITLQLRTTAFLLGLGFQLSQDRPLRGATLMVNQ